MSVGQRDSREFAPVASITGTIRPPADKSISHRAALLGAMSDGRTVIDGYLDSADTRSSLQAAIALGANVDGADESYVADRITMTGVGLRAAGSAGVDVGNAGTLLRLLPGWLAGQETGSWVIDGDASIRRRPVDRVVEPLRLMGARIECRDQRLPPVSIDGASLTGITYELPVASAQVKSCLLLAGLLAEGETRIIEPIASRDHTERMLTAAGAEIERDGNAITVQRAERLEPAMISVPADFSSAAFFIVAGCIVPGSEIVLPDVGMNPTRTGLLTALGRMGAEIEIEGESATGGEPTGTIISRHSALTPTEVGGDEIPLAIDELPLIALAACFAEGDTTIRDAGELRRKESDRIASAAAALRGLGAEVTESADGMVIHGTGSLRGGEVDSEGDHRIAMLGAVGGIASERGSVVHGIAAAAVSYPGFERDLAALVGD